MKGMEKIDEEWKSLFVCLLGYRLGYFDKSFLF